MQQPTSQEWVHVRDEPNHFHRYENEFVRVYDVRFGPGEKSLLHRHDEDTLYVTVHAARVREQSMGHADYSEIDLAAGMTACRPHRGEPLTHVVENRGDGLMRMIGAEVITTPPVTSSEPVQATGHSLHPEQPTTDRLRLYIIQLESGQTAENIVYDFSGLTVLLTEANLVLADEGGARRTLAGVPGDNFWHDGPLKLSITNVGPHTYRAILGEWCA